MAPSVIAANALTHEHSRWGSLGRSASAYSTNDINATATRARMSLYAFPGVGRDQVTWPGMGATGSMCHADTPCAHCLHDLRCGYCADRGCLVADPDAPERRASGGVQCFAPAWLHGQARLPSCEHARCTTRRTRDDCLGMRAGQCGWCTFMQACLPMSSRESCKSGWESHPLSPWTSPESFSSELPSKPLAPHPLSPSPMPSHVESTPRR